MRNGLSVGRENRKEGSIGSVADGIRGKDKQDLMF